MPELFNPCFRPDATSHKSCGSSGHDGRRIEAKLMSRTLIIGIGNPLRGDDGLGWRAVESLRQIASLQEVETVTCHQLTPEMAESVSRAERVVFIDAYVGSPP